MFYDLFYKSDRIFTIEQQRIHKMIRTIPDKYNIPKGSETIWIDTTFGLLELICQILCVKDRHNTCVCVCVTLPVFQ